MKSTFATKQFILGRLTASFPVTGFAKRESSDRVEEPRPFLQWVGGKREMLKQFAEIFSTKFKTYYEPFLGGGAVFFHLQPEKSVVSDVNAELVRAYEGVRDNPELVVAFLKEFKKRHSKELYMQTRALDRKRDILSELSSAEIAARMIYLNQTCFNGLYRVNQKGEFNVPIGSSLNRLICDERTIRSAAAVLKKTKIICADYSKVVQDAGKNDLVYIDPPYHPVSVYSDFNRYTKEKFYVEDQLKLRDTAEALSKRGCKVVLSNSDCTFVRNIYSDFTIREVYASRLLNSRSDKRGKVTELLITNF